MKSAISSKVLIRSKQKSVKFDVSKNEEIRFKQYSWERKKTIQDLINNPNKQKIQMTGTVDILEEYRRRNPNAIFRSGP